MLDRATVGFLGFWNFHSERHILKAHIYILVLAAASIANIVKSSLGPVGLDKMLVDEIGVNISKLPITFAAGN